MRVNLRYFAAARELLGRAREERETEDGATVGDVLDALAAESPSLASMRGRVMLMVNQGYVREDHPLAEGDELALIPPVSGGDGRFRVQEAPLDPRAVEALVDDLATGALVTFIGRVRDNARGKGVVGLDYEAYPEAAEQMMAQIGVEVRERWGLDGIAIWHRTGYLPVGETSVVICVSSPHRGDAFAAAQYAIERLKEIVPIWKKEHYADGATWIGSEAQYQREAEVPSESEHSS
jgi:molybdopterin synthase catalytic subunit